MTDPIEYQVNGYEYYIKTDRSIYINEFLFIRGTIHFDDANSDYSLELTELELYDRLNEIAEPILSGQASDYLLNNFSPSLYDINWNNNSVLPINGALTHNYLGISSSDSALIPEVDSNRHTMVFKTWYRNPSGGISQQNHVFHSTEDIDALLDSINGQLSAFPCGITDFDFNGGTGFTGRSCGFAVRTFPSTATTPAGHPLGEGASVYVKHIIVDSFTLCRRKLNYKVKITDDSIDATFLEKPCYLDLITGYRLDKRKIPQQISIESSIDKVVKLGFYRNNPYEQVDNLTSINYTEKQIKLKQNTEEIVDVKGLVLGTLWTNDPNITIKPLSVGSGSYELVKMIYNAGNIASLFAYWETLYNAEVAKQVEKPPFDPVGKTLLKETVYTSVNGDLKLLAANNDYWHNATLGNDIGVDIDHPLFKADDARTFKYHFKPQLDGSFGDLVMDSPRIIELRDFVEKIYTSLEAEKYSTNELDPNAPRVPTLGHLIEKIAYLLGYRPQPDGTFNKPTEDTRVRKIIASRESVDPKKVGVNNFGEDGMVLKRLNNRFKGNKIVADECVVVKDFIQLISEYHDQDNLAFGIQESSAIEINTESGTARYNNQLEILVDLITTVKDSQEMIRAALVSGLVTQGQTTEIIGGLGLPSVTKTLPITIDGKNKAIPYKGIAAHRSISQEVATVAYNVGIVTGQLI
jgi:hypothetical protein